MATTTPKKAAAKKAAAAPTTDTTPNVDELRDQVAALTQLVQQVLGGQGHPDPEPDGVDGVDDDQADAEQTPQDREMETLRAQLAELQTPEDPRETEIRELKSQIASLLAEKQQRADGTGPAKPVRYNLVLATGEVVEHDNAAGSTHHYSEKYGLTVPVTGVWLVPDKE
jgi:hypothetical protein